MNLSPDLERWRHEIEGYARQYGLDFYDVVFEVLDYDQLNEVAAYGGFPTRYPHWRFGMDYEELAKTYTYGLSKIYELVINNNPVYAYLMKSNAAVEQKLVMAHVFGHADFFKNNLWFAKTNRRMIDAMANHATRVRSYIDRHGVETVEGFIDACLSLENLIDYHAAFIERQDRRERVSAPQTDDEPAEKVPRLPSKGYMEPYINPPAFLEEQKARMVERAKRKKRVPEDPQRDVLQFLIEHAPLENWERDILGIVRAGGLLLRAPGHDEGHERGLGLLLALDDHDPARAHRLRGHRLRRPALGHDGHEPGPPQPLQDRHRALPRDRGPLEQGEVRQGIRRVRRHRRQAALGPQARPRPPEDLRGAEDLQRRDVHRRLHERGVLRAAASSTCTATTCAPAAT